MRTALFAVLVVASACKDDAPATRTRATGSSAPGDATIPVDATLGPAVSVSCTAAPLPPADPPRVASSPRVTFGKPSAAGLPGAVAVLHAHENRLRFCYEQNLGRAPTIAGTSKLSIIIKDTGHVHEVIVDDPVDGELALCIKHIVSELDFPKPKAQVTIVQPITFAWTRGDALGAEPTAWIPYAATTALVPSEVALVAALGLQKAIPGDKVASCLGARTGSLRAIARIGLDGAVTAASTGGLGDRVVEACISAALVGTKTEAVPVVTEVACDFVRGDPAPWRVATDAGYTVIDPAKPMLATPKPGETYLIVVEPATPASSITSALRAATKGAAYIIALHVDAGAPLFMTASRGTGGVPDPAAPLVLDSRDPLRICGGLLDAPASAPRTDADKLLANATKRCTHRPCPTQLTITVTQTKADELATLVAAARRVGFERIRLGEGACPAR